MLIMIMLDVLISNSQEYLNMQDVLVIGDSFSAHKNNHANIK